MNWRKTAELAIVERLLPLSEQGCYIENRPEIAAPNARVRLQIYYERSSPVNTTNTGNGISQRKRATFRCNLWLKESSLHHEIYDFMGLVENALTGFRPIVGSPHVLVPDDDQYQVKQDAWFYSMAFTLETQFTQKENLV